MDGSSGRGRPATEWLDDRTAVRRVCMTSTRWHKRKLVGLTATNDLSCIYTNGIIRKRRRSKDAWFANELRWWWRSFVQ